MKNIFCILLLLSVHIGVPAQNIQWQEGKRRMALPAADSLHIHDLIATGISLINNKTDSALILLREAKVTSERLSYNDGMALSLMGLSTCFAVKNNNTTATRYLNQAYPYCVTSARKNKYLIKWYRDQFLIYKYAGHVDSALATIQKAVPLLEKLKDTVYAINMYNHIGSILIDNQDYENAYPYILRAMRMNHTLNTDLLVSFINLGYVYSSREHMDSVYLWASRALDGARKLGTPRYERSASLLLVKYYLVKNNGPMAAAYAQNAIRLIDQNASDNRMYVYRLLSTAYLNQGKYNEGLKYGAAALQSVTADQNGRKDVIQFYPLMAKMYYALGHKDKAYHFLVKYNELSDSMNIVDRDKLVDQWEKQFQLSEKEKEIVQKKNQVLLQQNGIRNRNIWIGVASAGVLVLITLLIMLQRTSRRKMYMLRQQKEINELKAMMGGEEKERNRIAIELHDNVGGLLSAASYSLDTIKSDHEVLGGREDFKKIAAIITEVRNEIRKTAHTLMPDVLLRHSLAEAVRQYCAFIERDTGLQVDTQQQGMFAHVPKEVQLSLYRIVQELLQNIQKHAAATRVFVQLHSGNGIVSLTVEDNGKGIDTTKDLSGMGLQNIQNRLKVMGGSISFDSEAGKGTSVYIELSV